MLIQCLTDIDICKMALQWLISLLLFKNITFYIKIGNSVSNPAMLTSGGSLLNLLLFIIYIIPISHIINKYPTINYHLYDDDNILYHEVSPLYYQHIILSIYMRK